MKIGIVGDVHWSRYSSIVRLRGEKYSYRLENCIKSINWAEQLTAECSQIVYLGDFFDSSELNAEEITAIKDIQWNNQEHIFLVGNHEMGINDLSYSSSHLFEYIDIYKGSTVIDTPTMYEWSNCNVYFLPYILEEQRKSFSEYVSKENDKRTIVFSHNDIAGVQLGQYLSTKGFDISEIQNNCDLFLNGHLHNGTKVADKIINVGNLTGQNFSEDAFKYDHCVFILNTEDLSCAVYENPYAMNFYKLDTCEKQIDLNTLKQNAVVTLKTKEINYDKYKNEINNCKNILTSRLIVVPDIKLENTTLKQQELISVNHLDKFREYVLSVLGNSEIVLNELDEVLQ